jgi:signal transduction protein with GAF and PtsI domain
MNKLTFVAVCLALSFGISFAMITASAMGQPTYMNQSGINMSAPETAENAVPGNDTMILENDTSIGNSNNTLLNSMGTNENQSN